MTPCNHYWFFTTPTFGALITLPFNMNPFCWVWNTVPSSFPGTGAWNTASCTLGSNLSLVSAGSNLVKPCRFSVSISTVSVNCSPLCSETRSLCIVCRISEDTSSCGKGEDAESRSAGTEPSACSRLSTLAMRSFAKFWRAKSRTDCTSRFVRSCRLR